MVYYSHKETRKYETNFMECKWIKSSIKKGFEKFFNEVDADIFCIQETKMQEEQIDNDINNILKQYNCYWNSALKKDILEQQYLQKNNQ